jgi:hypothetical protein
VELDHSGDSVAHLEFHFFGAAPGYDAFDEILSNLNDYMGHHAA